MCTHANQLVSEFQSAAEGVADNDACRIATTVVGWYHYNELAVRANDRGGRQISKQLRTDKGIPNNNTYYLAVIYA